MSKRQISWLLAIMLIFNIFAVTASATPVIDSNDSTIPEAENIVVGMGIMSLKDDGTFDSKGEITVGEFIDSVLKFAGLDCSNTTPQPRYTDVPASHKYAKQIEMAHQMNIYRGLDVNNYGVDSKLTLGVAVRAVLNAAGYGEYTNARGGYPTGYFSVAVEKNVINKIAAEGTTLTRGGAAEIIYNALFLNIMTASITSNGTKYTEDTEKNVLSALHDAYEKTGVMTANAYVSLPAGRGLPFGSVKINGEVYSSDTIKADKYIGYQVKVIYTTNQGYNKMLAITPSKRNRTIVFQAEDVTGLSFDKLTYFPDDAKRATDYQLTPNTSVLSNYNAIPEMLDATHYAIPDNGTITLVDNNNDGNFDVVLMDYYNTLIVNSIDKANLIVYGKYYADAFLELTEYDKFEIKDPNGKVIKASEILKGDIAMYKVYPDMKNAEIQLVRTVETVKVDEIETLGDGTYPNYIRFVAGEKKYEVAPIFYKAKEPSKVTLGSTYEIHLDLYGKVANMVQKGSESLTFGYIVQADISKEGIDKTLELKVYTLNNEFVTFKTGEDVTFSGEGSINGAQQTLSSKKIKYGEAYEMLKTYEGLIKPSATLAGPYANGTVVGGIPVRYKLDSNNIITNLETPYKNRFVEGFRFAGVQSGSARYKKSGGIIGGGIMVDANSKMIKVAPVLNKGTGTNSGIDSILKAERYNHKMNITNEEYYEQCEAFSTTLDSAAAQYIINRGGGGACTLDTDTPAYAFARYTDSYDPETGVSGKNVVLFDGGDFVSYKIAEGSSVNDKKELLLKNHATGEIKPLQAGDLIRPAFNASNEIGSDVTLPIPSNKTAPTGSSLLVYSAANKAAAFTLSGLNGSGLVDGAQQFCGKIYRKLGSGAFGVGYDKKVSDPANITGAIYNFDTAKNVVLVDLAEPKDTNRFRIGSIDDIKTYYDVGGDGSRADMVYMFIREGALKSVVVFK